MKIAERMCKGSKTGFGEPFGAEEEEGTLAGKFVITKSEGSIYHLEKSISESSEIESVPWSHKSPLLKCHGW